ncbi:cell wall-binding repeat-containing protein [Euzebya tangerina]|uniref:cell wall-binding repeat-containing protein n=1 Tax=Euzebya tangerina TaxID=591198 RepID=UPI000E30DD03|nr:cell wall-binding repeat-containing protein [Euzebya tangerina]
MTTSRIKTLAVLAVAALGLALLPAAAGAASATSAPEAFRAAGFGTSFGDAVAANSFLANQCVADATGDAVDAGDDSDPGVDEPRGDIVEACTDYGPGATTLSIEVAEPTDPAVDDNWASSLAGWFIDTDDDGEGEYFASVAQDEDGTLVGQVFDIASGETPAPVVCDGTPDYRRGVLSISFDSGCIGSPDGIATNPGLIYDQVVTDPDGVATQDEVNGGDDEPFTDVLGSGTVPGGDTVTRLEGPERITTAIDISQQGWADSSADTVLIARDNLFPDALAGTPLAVDNGAPILLSRTDALTPETAIEVQRVLGDSGTVILLGGEVALSAQVNADVEALGYGTIRYGGLNRFETAAIIAGEGLGSPEELLVADGGDFQDPIVAGNAAAAAVNGVGGAAVLLTSDDRVPPETQAYLDANGDAEVTVIGRTAETALPDEDSIAADTDSDTSVLVAQAYYDSPTVTGIARDDVFADALTGGALIGSPSTGPGPLLLVQTDSLPQVVEEYLAANSDSIDAAVVFGGNLAVSDDVAAEVQTAIQ